MVLSYHGSGSAMEEFFQAYYIIAIHLHFVFLQVIAFAWVCLKADSQEHMIVHKRTRIIQCMASQQYYWAIMAVALMMVCRQGLPLAVILNGAGARRV